MSAGVLIVIPARFGSKRFPGKPLAQIAGRSMISVVADTARQACDRMENASFVVATDDERIMAHCDETQLPAVMTARDLESGSDRALAAAEIVCEQSEFIVNLQGDAPFTPPDYLCRIVDALKATKCDVATPCVQMNWAALDDLRAAKTSTPFSGTTCIVNDRDEAVWFSKTIIPAIRNENEYRSLGPLSPVLRHIGLYGFRRAALKAFTAAPVDPYESLEGLEQLRMLACGLRIVCVRVAAPEISTSGVDTPEDLDRLNARIAAMPAESP